MSMTQAGIDTALSEAQDQKSGQLANVSESNVKPSGLGGGSPSMISDGELQRILGLSVPITVTLAEREMTVESILEITVGTIIEFNASFDSELILSVANQPIGLGQAIKISEHFGLRVTSVGTVRHRIDALGAN